MLLPGSSILGGDGQRRACGGQLRECMRGLTWGRQVVGGGFLLGARAWCWPGARCVRQRTDLSCWGGGAGGRRLNPPGQRLGRSAKRGPTHTSAAAPSGMPTRRTMSTSRSVVICRSVLKMLQFHQGHLPRQGYRSWVMAQTRQPRWVRMSIARSTAPRYICTPRNADMSPRVSAS